MKNEKRGEAQELEGKLKERGAEVDALRSSGAAADKRIEALEEEAAQLRKGADDATQVRSTFKVFKVFCWAPCRGSAHAALACGHGRGRVPWQRRRARARRVRSLARPSCATVPELLR